jgi:predicted metal-dependent hydrolase
MGPLEPVLARIDPILAAPIHLSEEEMNNLVDFVREGLLDRRAMPEQLQKLIPRQLPSGFPPLLFQ